MTNVAVSAESKENTMEYRIQNLVLPIEAKHQLCRELFYHGDRGYLNKEEKTLSLGTGQYVDFNSYMNACSARKWKKYTNAQSFSVTIDIEGDCDICFTGYHRDMITIERKEYHEEVYSSKERRQIHYTFPADFDAQMIGFEVTAISNCTIYGGCFTTEIKESDLNEITLCIATTTMKKEAFIINNIAKIREEIMEADDDMKDHFYVHVVDNGRTLTSQQIYGPHISLHPNPNAGGSGGYARGMIESMNQTPRATHVLLMDDDVLILPESLRRTYNLLRLMKDHYKDHFISGAMLSYEEPFLQHEDIGTMQGDGFFRALKPVYDHRKRKDNLDNEKHFADHINEYAGWWYCCIPASQIEKNGYPLPLFIRGDDVEYSLRCHAKIITMNSICIWHMSFVTKYNPAFIIYQELRNFLIDHATTGVMENVNLLDFWYKSYRVELLKFNYDACALALRAMRDYLKGPEFIKINQGEKIAGENFKLNENLINLSDIPEAGDVHPDEIYDHVPLKAFDHFLLRLTFNGQRFCPSFLHKKGIGEIPFDHSYFPGRIAMHDRLLAVNPYNHKGIIRTIDKKKYRSLQKEVRSLIRTYKKKNDSIMSEYRSEKDLLTSENFWRSYLGMENHE